MRIDQLGEGTPELAIVGAIHGDEPCGAQAIEGLLETAPAVERPVKLVVANERALERGVRYVEIDLNRAFPGDPEGLTHESRLAHTLLRELQGCLTLSLHSTQSFARMFALVDAVSDEAREIVPALPITKLVETASFAEGRLLPHVRTIEIECGLQGSEQAAENAFHVSSAFLAATGALADPPAADGADPVDVFPLREQVRKPPASEYAVLVENFARVEAGQPFATADDRELVADRSFYPVLMSPGGYQDIFGYKADHMGTLEPTDQH